ncbi:MAG: mannosyltransferase [Flavobacteriales bacterium]|nr:MAG: mannosyltransferase [Flavobacteriales bacterium]
MPYPANYGGVIDVFYKLKYFHSKGIKIHLHCFEYGRGEQSELNKYCSSVNYYKRKTGVKSQISSTPYIVKSRTSKTLKENLLNNDFPILFEGLHSCFLLDDKAFATRFKIFRESNIEHDYYHHLAIAEKNVVKRKYYNSEAKKLEKFEPIIKHANLTCVVSLTDLDYFKKKYPNNNIVFVPSFHSGESVNVKPGKGDYVLYHGNLSVAENKNAAKFIIQNLFQNSDIPLKIAGLNPSTELVKIIDKNQNIELIENPSDNEMNELIANAQLNLLYTEQATGLKLKLLNVLYNGRHCIVNSKMVQGTSLSNICLIEDDIYELKKLIESTFKFEFSEQDLVKRKSILLQDYSNENSYQKIIGAF